MTCPVLRPLARASVALAVLAAPALSQTRGFLVRLGADTITVERFTKTGDRIEGTRVNHSPATTVLRYTITLNKDGSVASYEQTQTRGDGSALPNAPALQKMMFEGDSVTRVVTAADGQTTTRRTAVPKGTLPAIGGSWLFYELALQQAKRDGSGGYQTIGFGAQQNAAAAKIDVKFVGTDSAETIQLGFRTGFRLDRNGQITRGDGSLSTQKFLATPARDIDVAAVASAWAAKDAAGQAMGIASPRDTMRVTLGGASVVIDYGQPAMRGREIWGKLVPFDTVWRLGANSATQLRTDKDLDIGGKTVPAGLYTLWLLPTAKGASLIVGTQSSPPAAPLWGTDFSKSTEVVRIPLAAHMNLPSAEERFHIFMQGDMLMFHWDKGGYGVRIRAK
jgi:hypothetical protein